MKRKTREKKTVLEMGSPDGKPERKVGDNGKRKSITSDAETNRKGHSGAARRLGLTPVSGSDVESLPFQATLAFAFRGAGGKATAIEYARLAAPIDERFLRFICAYDKLSATDQNEVRLEDLCKAAEILPHEFLGGIAAIAHKYNVDVGNLMAAIHHPEIVEATIESAKSPFGTDDRRMLHTHHGFLPTGKGNTVNVPIQINQGAGPAQISQGPLTSLPRFESDIRDVAQIVRGDTSASSAQKALPPPAIDEEIVE